MKNRSTPVTDLSILILNYDTQFWLKKVLTSLQTIYLANTKYQVEVVVIDNNSTDDSVKMLKRQFKWVELIALPKNQGYAAGNNAALKTINSRYVMLLNSDIEFTAQSNLDLLIDYLDDHKTVSIITPKLILTNKELDPACHRGEPTPWASLTYFLKLEQMFPQKPRFGQYHQTYKDLSTIHQIDACSGAAMIVRTSKMKKVGYLDERFFMYAEDLDWCKRFREAGAKIIFHPGVTLIHHKYKSGIKSDSDRTTLKIKGHFYDTMLQYFDKHYKDQHPKIYRALLKYFLFIKKGGV